MRLRSPERRPPTSYTPPRCRSTKTCAPSSVSAALPVFQLRLNAWTVTLVDTGASLDGALSRVIDAVVATKPHVSRAVGGMRSMLATRLENLAVARQLVDQTRENVAAFMELEG
jgi:hypothetical protein